MNNVRTAITRQRKTKMLFVEAKREIIKLWKPWVMKMSISRPKVENIWNWYPSLRDNGIAKIVWFEVLNLALCFTVQMGFQSSDAIITKGLDESFNISGLYTLLISIIIYFVILRSVLLEFFSSGKFLRLFMSRLKKRFPIK